MAGIFGHMAAHIFEENDGPIFILQIPLVQHHVLYSLPIDVLDVVTYDVLDGWRRRQGVGGEEMTTMHWVLDPCSPAVFDVPTWRTTLASPSSPPPTAAKCARCLVAAERRQSRRRGAYGPPQPASE
uniref:Uncharacterized protein n=1 Tax=Pseudictyota dubia TaxID=2749911 RepID=A0A7R9WBG9_9STRA